MDGRRQLAGRDRGRRAGRRRELGRGRRMGHRRGLVERGRVRVPGRGRRTGHRQRELGRGRQMGHRRRLAGRACGRGQGRGRQTDRRRLAGRDRVRDPGRVLARGPLASGGQRSFFFGGQAAPGVSDKQEAGQLVLQGLGVQRRI